MQYSLCYQYGFGVRESLGVTVLGPRMLEPSCLRRTLDNSEVIRFWLLGKHDTRGSGCED